MVYKTEQVTNNATPTLKLMTEVTNAFTAHPSWTFVKTYTQTGWEVSVWRSTGAANGTGKDVVVAYGRTTNAPTSAVRWLVSEGFNAATDQFIRPAGNPANTYTPDAVYSSLSGDTGVAWGASNTNPNVLNAVSSVDFTYWLKVTKRGAFCVTTADTFASYAGLFEPLWPHPQEYPVWMWEMGDNDVDGSGSATRRPSVSTSILDTFAIESSIDRVHAFTTPMGTIPSGSALYAGISQGSRYLLTHAETTNGEYRGLAYDCLVLRQDVDVARGDTVDVQGDTYVLFLDAVTYGLWVNTEAA